MDRSNDIKLPAETAWLLDPAAQAVCAAIEVGGGKVYFVGGCVRDALLGVSGSDIDLSTDVTPDEVTRLVKAAGLKSVPTGIDHGTVTVVADGKGFEVTTFRRDIATDGRRAVVTFSTDITDDARRRDFTMNALYAAPDGTLVDPLGGLEDCLTRRVRFIEDASKRVTEDYLRILRYFRFHAWYAKSDDGFDPDALDAISRNIGGLETLSAERIGSEILKLLGAPDPAPAIAAMRQTGCLAQLLPGSDDRFLGPVVHLEQAICTGADPLLRLAALGGEDTVDRLRLSRSDGRRLGRLVDAGYGMTPLPALAYQQGYDDACAAAILRAAFSQAPLSEPDLLPLEHAAQARFPISARDLMPAFEGKALGDKIQELEHRWIASEFTLTREELMTDD